MSSNIKTLITTTNAPTELGQTGEDAAVNYLKVRGYQIIVRNFKTQIGRNRKGVAVSPQDSVTLQKQRQITRTAREYRKFFNLNDLKHRFDVVTVNVKLKRAPKIEHLKNYWATDKFRKRIWNED
jgi:Holliday junction resolvase-like predicted endonuclease